MLSLQAGCLSAALVALGLSAGCAKGSNEAAPSAARTATPAATLVPSAPATSAPTPSPPPVDTGPRSYAVFGVMANDVLNVRAEPSASSKKVLSYAPDATGIVATGRTIEKDTTPWLEVKLASGSGWLNRLFVTEQHAGNPCADPNLTAAVRAFMRAVAAADASAVQALVSPLRGLSVRQADWNPAVAFAFADVPSLFTSSAPRKWGTADGSGDAIVEPFKARLLASLRRAVVGKGAQEACGKLLLGGSAARNEWPPEYAHLTYVSLHQPDDANGWVTWVVGMEYVDAKPYVATLVQYQWEI